MAWWNDIRDLLKAELAAPPEGAAAAAAPQPLRQAQLLLQRTARELVQARQQAEAVRHRLARTQAQLEALTRAPQAHPRYRERLVELARAIARDSDLAGGFQAHLAQLDQLHDQVNRQLRELDHDLAMARTASAIGQATQAVAAHAGARPRPAAGAAKPRKPKPAKDTAAKPAGFRRARSSQVMDALQQLPRRRPDDRRED
jgi:phage shock protein A